MVALPAIVPNTGVLACAWSGTIACGATSAGTTTRAGLDDSGVAERMAISATPQATRTSTR